MGRNDLLRLMAVLFIIGCLAVTTECRLGAGVDQDVNTTAVNSTSSVYDESKRNGILCGLKACVGKGGDLYRCYCCVRPGGPAGLTCFPSADDCEFRCR